MAIFRIPRASDSSRVSRSAPLRRCKYIIFGRGARARVRDENPSARLYNGFLFRRSAYRLLGGSLTMCSRGGAAFWLTKSPTFFRPASALLHHPRALRIARPRAAVVIYTYAARSHSRKVDKLDRRSWQRFGLAD